MYLLTIHHWHGLNTLKQAEHNVNFLSDCLLNIFLKWFHSIYWVQWDTRITPISGQCNSSQISPVCDSPSQPLRTLKPKQRKSDVQIEFIPDSWNFRIFWQQTLDFIVEVGGTLGCYFLNYVHRGPVVTAHTLIMTADHAVRSPQRKDNVAAVWAVVVAADAVPLGRSQSVEGHGGRPLAIWDTVTPMVPPQHGQQNYDDQKEDHAARDNPHKHSWLRAIVATTGVCLSCFWACVCQDTQKTGRRKERENWDELDTEI